MHELSWSTGPLSCPTHPLLLKVGSSLSFLCSSYMTYVYYRDNAWGGGTGSCRTTRIFRGATVLQLLGNLTFSDYVFKIFSSKTLDIFAPAPNLPMGRAYVLNFILWNKIQYTIVVQKHATAWVKNIFLLWMKILRIWMRHWYIDGLIYRYYTDKFRSLASLFS